MEKVGIRELRQQASVIIRRVATGETFEVTDRGRVVALLVGTSSRGLDALIEQGKVRAGEGHLLNIKPIPIPRGSRPPSAMVAEGRAE